MTSLIASSWINKKQYYFYDNERIVTVTCKTDRGCLTEVFDHEKDMKEKAVTSLATAESVNNKRINTSL